MRQKTFLSRFLALALCLAVLAALTAGCEKKQDRSNTGLRALENGIWRQGSTLFREEAVTREDAIRYGAKLYNSIIESSLSGCHVYYAVIPDKNYFIRDTAGFPVLDYDALLDAFTGELRGAAYVDILDTLSPEDYYLTDYRWRQTELFDTVEALARAMGVEAYLTPREDYTAHTLSRFRGIYARNGGVPELSDELVYLTGAYTESAAVSGPLYDFDSVYVPSCFGDADGGDVFLGGTQPLLFLENEDAKTDRELYIFRDSFGSCLAPLFLGAYRKITLIDLRYISSFQLADYVSFTPGSDVLILNSVLTLNMAYEMR